MKIGILTYHCVPNFGAQLQALSTVEYVKRQGHVPVVLNWYPLDLEKMYAGRIPREQVMIHSQFANRQLPLTKRCYNENDLINIIKNEDIDGVIVGSDALFKYIPIVKRYHLNKNRIIHKQEILSVDSLKGNPFWGSFISLLPNGIKAAAFSVSSQNCPYNSMFPFEKKRMKNALNNYSYISVRDKWTQQMIKKMTGEEVDVTPDPVFAFNQNCSNHIPSRDEIQKKFHLPDRYVLLSFSSWFVNADYITQIAKALMENGFSPVLLPMPEGVRSDVEICQYIHLPIDPLDWYSLIIYSFGFIGERMHPIVVCLHNNIPFFSFDEYGTYKRSLYSKKYIPKSSKTYSIVKEAGLINNLYSYKWVEPLPAANEITNKLLSFDKLACQTFSLRFLKEYDLCMQKVLSCIA